MPVLKGFACLSFFASSDTWCVITRSKTKDNHLKLNSRADLHGYQTCSIL